MNKDQQEEKLKMPRTGRGIKRDGLIQMRISSLESRGGEIKIIKSGGKGKLPAETHSPISAKS